MRMTMPFSLILLPVMMLLAPLACGQQRVLPKEAEEQEVVHGTGWGQVRLRASKADIERVLGKGDKTTKFDYVYFVDYEAKGVQVGFGNWNDTVVAIFFYNKDVGYEQFATFRGKTSKGIGWDATAEQVMEAYGKPVSEFSGISDKMAWRRIAFDGIDFRFVDGKMVRIGIPGK